jgi:hypothetical protein
LLKYIIVENNEYISYKITMKDRFRHIDYGPGLDMSTHPESLLTKQELRAQKLFNIGQRLGYADLCRLDTTNIIVIGNSKIKKENFDLRRIDHDPIGGVQYPGKSAMIDFLDLPARETINSKERDTFATYALGKPDKSRNWLYYSSVDMIEDNNFCVFYTPVGGNSLHLRIVYKPNLNLQYPLSSSADAPVYARKRLKSVWTRQRLVDES